MGPRVIGSSPAGSADRSRSTQGTDLSVVEHVGERGQLLVVGGWQRIRDSESNRTGSIVIRASVSYSRFLTEGPSQIPAVAFLRATY
jgi:hypothetical protein